MGRWSTLEGSINKFSKPETKGHFLKNFFENKAFIPETEKEKEEYKDFSFVSSAMALLVYIARANRRITENEKKLIMDELQFQLEQRHLEYEVLSYEISPVEKKILNTLFEKFDNEIEKNICDLDEIIRIIDMIYQKNPYKRNYLFRMCNFVGYADKNMNFAEQRAIDEISKKLMISPEDKKRIEKEVKKELNIK